MIFHFILFPGKTNDKIFSKNAKNTILGPFCPFLGKTKLPSKFCPYEIVTMYHCAKFQEKLVGGFKQHWFQTQTR